MKRATSLAFESGNSVGRFRTLALCILMGVAVELHATPITISGSHRTGGVNISSTLGSNGTVEASAKLKASGDITYDYSLTFDLDVGVPVFAGPGDTVTVNPWLTNTGASLTGSQSITYTNDLSLMLDVPDGLPGIPNQIGFSNVTIPRVTVPGSGFAYLQGEGSLASTGSTYTDNYLGRGYVTANGDFLSSDGSASAWRAGGVDIFDTALNVAALPGIPGFGLYPTVGVDIFRKDLAWLVDYEFTAPLQFTIPSNLSSGDTFSFSANTWLRYDLSFVSFFAYGGNFLLEFDIPDWIPGFPNAYGIKLADLGRWDVAVVSYDLEDLLLPVTVSGSMTLGEEPEACKRLQGTPSYMACLLHLADQQPLDAVQRQRPVYPSPVSDRTFDVSEVPEPSVITLLSAGLLNIVWLRRWRRESKQRVLRFLSS